MVYTKKDFHFLPFYYAFRVYERFITVMLVKLALLSEHFKCLKTFVKIISNIVFHKIVVELKTSSNKTIEYLNINTTEFKKNALFTDILCCYFAYDIKPYEYFLLNYNTLNAKQRGEFITDVYKDKICLKISNLNDFNTKIKDKYSAYLHFKELYKREIIKVTSQDDFSKFDSFIKKHNSFVVKPVKGARGIGIQLIDIESNKNNVTELFNKLILEKGTCVIEERIHQANEMAQCHQYSINTVRCPGVLNNNTYSILAPIMRTGKNGSFVDNATQGGIFANININTGIIYTDGYDEFGNIYETHPDTNTKFKGFVIPKWEDLKQIAHKAACLLPSNPYIAWDFALTDNGWVIVEANWGQFLMYQIAEQKGVKKEFLQLIKSYLK